MIKLFFKRRQQENKNIYQLLHNFYDSFFSDAYNELNISKYKPIRDAIGLVINKFDSHDHPLEYTGKLILYIQNRQAMNHIGLNKKQEAIMIKLAYTTKYANINNSYRNSWHSEEQFA